ncbi:unnamed protein product [Polarella glacialis]|uniref:Uncharacterized protein n=1 Tax=Polarella glacialis TaxID=89957 RepID=A0A813JGJ2_POLGL|nr:unnamed protein product [Polarella glacialis]
MIDLRHLPDSYERYDALWLEIPSLVKAPGSLPFLFGGVLSTSALSRSVADLKDALLDLHPHLDFYGMAIYDSQGEVVDEADSLSMMETYTVEDQPAVPPSVWGPVQPSMGHVEATPENIDTALGDEPKSDQPDAQPVPLMAGGIMADRNVFWLPPDDPRTSEEAFADAAKGVH